MLLLWTMTGKRAASHWYSIGAWDDVARDAHEYAAHSDVYFGVGLRSHRLSDGKHGGSNDVVCLPAVHVDLDIRHSIHQATNLPASEDEALSLLKELPPSSMLVRSGHGLHSYWLLEKPWLLNSSEDRINAESLARDFQRFVKERANSVGLHVDSTFDLARVLRLPGTTNHKEEPVPVQLLRVDASHRYRPDDLREALCSGSTATRTASPATQESRAAAPSARSYSAGQLPLSEQIHQLIQLGYDGTTYPSRSEALAAAEHALIEAGCADAEIASIVLNPAHGISDLPREKGNDWARADIARARAKHQRQPTAFASPPKQLRLLSRRELEHIPPVTWLIEGMIPCGSFVVLFGPPGCGKSFVALSWAASVACGTAWLGRAVRSSPAVYVAAEGVTGLSLRLRAWEQSNFDERFVDDLLVLPTAINLLDEPSVTALIQVLRGLPVPPALVVIDTLARCIVGGDENSAKDVGKAIAAVDRIRALTGSAVLLVHHTAKERNIERGSSALRGAVDAMFALTEGAVVLSCEKMKDSELAPDTYLQLRKVELGNGATSCVVDSSGPRLTRPLNDTSRRALTFLRDFGRLGATYSEWLKASKLDDSTFKRSLKILKDARYISRNGKYNVLTSAGRLALGEKLEGEALDALLPQSAPKGNGEEREEQGSRLNQGSEEAHEPGAAQGSRAHTPLGVSPEPEPQQCPSK